MNSPREPSPFNNGITVIRHIVIGKDIEDQVKEEVKAIETARILLGFMQKPEAIRHLQVSESVHNPVNQTKYDEEELQDLREERREEHIETWEAAKSGLQSPPDFNSSQVDLLDLPDEDEIEDHIQTFTNQEYFQSIISDIDDWDFKLVPLESLVAFQKSVTKTAYKDIPTSDDGWEDVVKYCLPVQGDNYVMEQGIQTPNQSFQGIQFVSRGPNIDVSGPHVERHGPEEDVTYTVSFQVHPRPNFVQVVEFGGRYILKNGYHRSFQLLQAGETHVPALVRQANHYQETGAAKDSAFPQGILLGQRPPLVSDFHTDAAVDIKTAATNKVLRVLAETTHMRR